MSEMIEKDGVILERAVCGGETFTAVEDCASDLGHSSTEEFVKELRNCRVLDLGSGLGGLAKSAVFKQLPCEIYSVNPRLEERHRKDEREATRNYVLAQLANRKTQKRGPRGIISGLFGEPKENSEQIISQVQEAYDKFARRAFAHELPFKDSFFDLIIDNQAVSKYAGRPYDNFATPEEKVRFKQTIVEILRVLKPGGKIRIGDPDYGYGEEDGKPISWKEQVFKKIGVEYRLILVKPEYPVPPFLLRRDGTMVMGVEVIKK